MPCLGTAAAYNASMYRNVRVAVPADAPAIAVLANAAFRVEDFFKVCDRTDAAEVEAMMGTGVFLVLDAPETPEIGRAHV